MRIWRRPRPGFQVSGSGAGLMNGLANGGASLAPLIVGYFINLTGSFGGGLLFLVGLGILGLICLLPLWKDL